MRYLLISYTDFDKLQGQNIRLAYIIKGLLRRNRDVHLIVSRNANAEHIKNMFGSRLNIYKFYISTPRFAKFKLFRYFLFFISARFYIKALIKKIKPDIIYAQNLLPGYPAAKAFDSLKGSCKIKLYYDIFDFYYDFLRLKIGLKKENAIIRILKLIEKYPLTKATGVITISKNFKKEIIRLANIKERKVEVVYEGADPNLFSPVKPNKNLIRRYKIKKQDVVVAFVGGIEKHDGLDIVVDAADIIRKNYAARGDKKGRSSIRFMLVGSGTYVKCLKQKIAEKKLNESFIFTGWVDYINVKEYLSIADICLLPLVDSISTQVIITTKLYEYLACKKAVIASNLPALHEIIKENKNGIFFRPSDSYDLAEKIILLANDAKLLKKTANEGYNTVKNNFTIQKQSEKIVSFIESAK